MAQRWHGSSSPGPNICLLAEALLSRRRTPPHSLVSLFGDIPQRLKVRGSWTDLVRTGEADPEVLLDERRSSFICLSILATSHKAVDGRCWCLILRVALTSILYD
ncbi:hypothetical protein E2C01_063835 [Portunus trituberculatus]|uniref:Uncharacterized protein n=1 Tax=Portunus trituberculatus TaxID=210409 RepID=A0A5B7HJ94_PORTR|nr:hypothetical protein [Portunus trituberculatus]